MKFSTQVKAVNAASGKKVESKESMSLGLRMAQAYGLAVPAWLATSCIIKGTRFVEKLPRYGPMMTHVNGPTPDDYIDMQLARTCALFGHSAGLPRASCCEFLPAPASFMF